MSSPHAFDRAVTLMSVGQGRATGQTSPDYANFNGQFGGITAAILLRAVLDDPRAQGAPVAFSANYTAAVQPGAYEVQIREIRRGRTLQHWGVDMIQGDKVCATALVALAQRQHSWSHAPLAIPAAPPPEDCAPLEMGDWKGWVRQYDMRFLAGSTAHLQGQPPLPEPGSARSLLWLRHSQPRPLDFPGLLCMSDAFFVRMIQVRNTFPAMGTVSISTYFHCSPDMLTAQGGDYLLAHVDSRVFRDNFHDQSAELWSRDGQLLANTHQIVWYAE